jgi:hypothetical protein
LQGKAVRMGVWLEGHRESTRQYAIARREGRVRAQSAHCQKPMGRASAARALSLKCAAKSLRQEHMQHGGHWNDW